MKRAGFIIPNGPGIWVGTSTSFRYPKLTVNRLRSENKVDTGFRELILLLMPRCIDAMKVEMVKVEVAQN